MKKTELKRHKRLGPMSKKREAQMIEYHALVDDLTTRCANKSELSGKIPNWESHYTVDPHHIDGRTGDKLLDPFNIIMLTREEHDIEEGKRKGEKQGADKLRSMVYWIRVSQGFEPKEQKMTTKTIMHCQHCINGQLEQEADGRVICRSCSREHDENGNLKPHPKGGKSGRHVQHYYPTKHLKANL